MRAILSFLYVHVGYRVPQWMRPMLRSLGVANFVAHFLDKHTAELSFQTAWASEFKKNINKVFDYWEKYRYLREIKSEVSFDNDTRILDVGCGISTVLHFLPGQRYGIDPLAEYYKQLYSYPEGMTIAEGSGEEMSFEERFFDVVFCTNVIDHVSDPSKVIENIWKVLRDRGHFILTAELFNQHVERDAAHPHSLSREDVVKLVDGKFEFLMERESPWIGMRNYVKGKRHGDNKELILLMRKNEGGSSITK